MNRQRENRQFGFTLIELMIVVTVVAILASFALPSYSEYVRRGNRADAKSVMLQAANWLQQQYTLNNTYLGTGGAQPLLPAAYIRSPASGTAKYNISISGAATASTYTLQAVPVQDDPRCGTLGITQDGIRMVNGGTDEAQVDYCWNR